MGIHFSSLLGQCSPEYSMLCPRNYRVSLSGWGEYKLFSAFGHLLGLPFFGTVLFSDSDVVFSQAEDLLAASCNQELAVPHWNSLHIASVSQRLDLTTLVTLGLPCLPAMSPHRGGSRAPPSSPAHKAAWKTLSRQEAVLQCRVHHSCFLSLRSTDRPCLIAHVWETVTSCIPNPRWLSGKEPACQYRRHETWVQSLCQKDPPEEGTAITPVFLSGESHGQRILASYSPWDHKRVRPD